MAAGDFGLLLWWHQQARGQTAGCGSQMDRSGSGSSKQREALRGVKGRRALAKDAE